MLRGHSWFSISHYAVAMTFFFFKHAERHEPQVTVLVTSPSNIHCTLFVFPVKLLVSCKDGKTSMTWSFWRFAFLEVLQMPFRKPSHNTQTFWLRKNIVCIPVSDLGWTNKCTYILATKYFSSHFSLSSQIIFIQSFSLFSIKKIPVSPLSSVLVSFSPLTLT